VSDWYIRTQARDAAAEQRLTLHDRYGVHNDKVAAALAMMEARLEEPASRGELAAAVGISVRQLERLFASTTGQSIAGEYRKLRLERAATMLRETGMSVTEVAVACGFVSQAHFSRLVKRHFGCPPLQLRHGGPAATSQRGTRQNPAI
jgi:transcriptional regulator GlxA family with amidase domain